MHESVENGDLDMIEKLFKEGMSVNQKDEVASPFAYSHALILPSLKFNAKIVRMLIALRLCRGYSW